MLKRAQNYLVFPGISSDFRDLEIAADEGKPKAKLALEVLLIGLRNTLQPMQHKCVGLMY